ncbi:MAG: hypothetical protein LKG31_04060 [Lactobacillus sp.]|jgi:hypothetical protein|nr:hypothetical protein [Lactobacillus sp.]
MKIKRGLHLALTLTFSSLLLVMLAGCSKTKKTQPAKKVVKTEFVSKAKSTLPAGQNGQTIKLTSSQGTQILTATSLFGGKPTVVHVASQYKTASKKQLMEMWLSGQQLYLHGQTDWYKTQPSTILAAEPATFTAALQSNDLIKNLTKAEIKQAKLKQDDKLASLSYDSKANQSLAKDAAQEIIAAYPAASNQQKYFNQVLDQAQFGQVQLFETINKKSGQIKRLTVKTQLTVQKQLTVKLSLTYQAVPRQAMLQLPIQLNDAKPLPKKSTK